jgi:hypothetical protein
MFPVGGQYTYNMQGRIFTGGWGRGDNRLGSREDTSMSHSYGVMCLNSFFINGCNKCLHIYLFFLTKKSLLVYLKLDSVAFPLDQHRLENNDEN